MLDGVLTSSFTYPILGVGDLLSCMSIALNHFHVFPIQHMEQGREQDFCHCDQTLPISPGESKPPVFMVQESPGPRSQTSGLLVMSRVALSDILSMPIVKKNEHKTRTQQNATRAFQF